MIEREKGLDKKGFSGYFNYKPSALMSKLLGQNTQDLKKSLDKIKQQKTKSKEIIQVIKMKMTDLI